VRRRHAELLITGRIATLEGDAGMGWTQALAIGGGRVLAHGPAAALDELVGPRTRRLGLGPDEAVVPALADAHLHLLDSALAGERLDLTGLAPPAALERVAAAHAALDEPDAWLEGDGWDADAWGTWPDAAELDRAAPGRRVALWAHDRHALWVSTRALDEAGISARSDDPAGGMVRRRDDATPSGVLHETAAALVLARIPPPAPARRAEAVERLSRRLVVAGLGAVHDPGSMVAEAGLAGVDVYRTLDESGRLPLAVHVSVRRESLAAAVAAGLRSGDRLVPGLPEERVNARFGWLKLFADGTLGSRTAAMLEPFERGLDGAAGGGLGMFQLAPAELAALVEQAAAAGLATQVHAIGDASVRAALHALAPSRRRAALAPRIEHAQLVDAADLPRFGVLGIVASVQPAHLGTDAATARMAWGERADRAYPYRSIAAGGGVLAFGTDAPIEPWDPWPGLEEAVTRRSPAWPAGTPALGPAEALDLAAALRAATVGPAIAAGRPDVGRLVAGGRADLLVIDAEALAIPVVAGGPLGRTRPRLVLLGGREVASR
jgi:predicted amidohydrolase YtcJ